MFSSTGEPYTITEALNDPKWHQAMEEEYDATRHGTPQAAT
jgi:hypothetical protein